MRIVVCEDNDIERMLLITALEELNYNDVTEFSSCEDMFSYISKNIVDVILLDIGMPGMNGMEAASAIRKYNKSTSIIFITAYEHFALEAFKVYAVDYIVKPLKKERLAISLERVGKSNSSNKKSIQVRNRSGAYTIKEEDIIFIEKYLYKCIINTEDGIYEISMNLKELEELLDPKVFCRTHNGFLVNRTKVSKVIPAGNMTYTIYFKNTEKTALLSRTRRELLLNDYDF